MAVSVYKNFIYTLMKFEFRFMKERQGFESDEKDSLHEILPLAVFTRKSGNPLAYIIIY